MNQLNNQDQMRNNQNLMQSTTNGTLFDDITYHGSEKLDFDRSIIKEYKSSNEIDPGSFVNGSYVQNRSFNNQSSIQKSTQSFLANCQTEPDVTSTMCQQFEHNEASMSNMRHNIDKTISDEYLWFYLDPRSNVQGPFLDSQMFQWWSQGIYFQNSLLMKRKCDADFSTLQEYSKRFNGVPFNRKDTRVPPLTESLTVQSQSNAFNDSKIYTNSPLAPMHRNVHQMNTINDQNYVLQLLSNTPNSSTDELRKMLQKNNNIQQRIPPQMTYEQTLNSSMIPNSTEQFSNSAGSSSLSNFVNLRLNNPVQHKSGYIPDLSNSGHIANYLKTERFPSTSWGGIQQPKLKDSVWTSTSDDTIHSSNPVWSRSSKEPATDNSSVMNTIFPDTQSKNSHIPTNQHKSNQMQESWDNLDPAIITIIPQSCDTTNHSTDNRMLKETLTSTQMEQNMMYLSTADPLPTHFDSMKHPWADLVRKGNSSVSNQKSKSGFSSVSPNQHKNSLTSNSSDEYDHMTIESSDKDLESLINWCKSYLETKPGISDVDIGTLIDLLIYVESPYEMEATMRENVPQFDNISEFVKIFIERRRPLRQKLFADKQVKSVDKSTTGNNEEDTKWQVTKSKSTGNERSCKKKSSKKNNMKN